MIGTAVIGTPVIGLALPGLPGVPGLIAIAAGLAVFGLGWTLLVVSRPPRAVTSTAGGRGADPGRGTGVSGPGARASETRLVQDVVAITGRVADRLGLLARVERSLAQADLPLRAPEALAAVGALALVLLGLGWVAAGPMAGLLLGALAVAGPAAQLEVRRLRRLRAFETQLPDVLNLLAGSLRAGFSFVQGLGAVAEEADEPARRELGRAVAESRLGRPVEDALQDVADRMGSTDLEWAVMAIRIQREVGGNLAELLDTVAQTMTARERLRHEIGALTAEGRLSAWVLGAFPIVFGGILFLVQPTYLRTLFTEPLGVAALVGSGVLAVAGFLWLRRIMRIEV